MGERECGCIIGDVVLEELGIDCIDEGLALRADVLDAAIVDGGAVCLFWRNGFGEAQGADGRLCVGDVGEVVVASGCLGDQRQRMRMIIMELKSLIGMYIQGDGSMDFIAKIYGGKGL